MKANRFGALVVILMLVGCGITPRADVVPARTFWWPTHVYAPASSRLLDELYVTVPVGAPGFNSTAMIYETERAQLVAYSEHRWVEEPALMLLPALTAYLETRGRIGAAVSSAAQTRVRWQLDVQHLALWQQFRAADAVVRLRFRVQLKDLQQSRLLASRWVDLMEPCAQADIQGFLGAVQPLFEASLQEVERMLEESFPAATEGAGQRVESTR